MTDVDRVAAECEREQAAKYTHAVDTNLALTGQLAARKAKINEQAAEIDKMYGNIKELVGIAEEKDAKITDLQNQLVASVAECDGLRKLCRDFANWKENALAELEARQ